MDVTKPDVAVSNEETEANNDMTEVSGDTQGFQYILTIIFNRSLVNFLITFN